MDVLAEAAFLDQILSLHAAWVGCIANLYSQVLLIFLASFPGRFTWRRNGTSIVLFSATETVKDKHP
jgi:hypothetical protein